MRITLFRFSFRVFPSNCGYFWSFMFFIFSTLVCYYVIAFGFAQLEIVFRSKFMRSTINNTKKSNRSAFCWLVKANNSLFDQFAQNGIDLIRCHLKLHKWMKKKRKIKYKKKILNWPKCVFYWEFYIFFLFSFD